MMTALGRYKCLTTPGVETPSPVGFQRHQTHLVASYDHAGLNGGGNSDALTRKVNPQLQW
jgi:hypothetical protein